jgi:4-amino-4-deoxy-L-arabinose transferase-like glycosyltransferase
MALMMKNSEKKNSNLVLIAILIVGAILRFYGLGEQSLWTDELASWDFSRKDTLVQVIKDTIEKDHFPPAYYILLHSIIKYAGDSEALLRLPSVIAGLLSIIVIYYLGIRLYSRKEGLIAAAIMAVMWCPIYYSQEARSYIFLVLFSTLSVNFWLKIIERLENNLKPQKKDITFYVIFSSLCCYTHYFGGYLIALQGLATVIIFLRKKWAWRYILLIYFFIGVLFSAWLPAFWHHVEVAPPGGSQLNKPISLILFLKFLGFIFGAQKSPFVNLETYSKIDVIISVSIILVTLGLMGSLVLIKFYSYFKKDAIKKRVKLHLDPDIILFVWLVMPYLGIYILSKLSFNIFRYRYFLISLPAAYLLISRSITKLFSKKGLQLTVVLSFLILFSFHLIYYKNYYSIPIKAQFREVVNYVAENDDNYNESTIIAYTYDNFFDYYAEKKKLKKEIYLYFNEEKDIIPVIDRINLIKTKYIWLISAHLSPDDKFISLISKNYKIIKEKRFTGAKVLLFRKI